MPKVLIIGGTGQIGHATALHLTAQGWSVSVAARSRPARKLECEFIKLDREDPKSLKNAVGGGVDLLLDCVAFDDQHATQLASLKSDVGHIVAISSASVYCDDAGRTLDEARETGFPDWPIPIPEDNPTVPPGSSTYSTRKAAMERQLLASLPTGQGTILRPCAIHGPYSKHAREWWFVKRLLDGRARIPLAYGGRSRFHTTSAKIIAAAVHAAWQGALGPVATVVDRDAPTVAEIGTAIMQVMGRRAELIGLPDEPFPPGCGFTPWSTEKPLVCASSFDRHRTYADEVTATIEWLVSSISPDSWQSELTQLAGYPRDHFDYATEDAVLDRRAP